MTAELAVVDTVALMRGHLPPWQTDLKFVNSYPSKVFISPPILGLSVPNIIPVLKKSVTTI